MYKPYLFSPPGWVLRPSGILAAVDLDIVNRRYFARGGPNAITDLLTTVRASTGYAATSTGLLVPFSANVPRITNLGLLLEEARTNVCLQSNALATSPWTTFQSGAATTPTVTNGTGDVSDPAGGNTASKIVFPAIAGGGDNSAVRQAISGLTNPTTLAPSIWLRTASGTATISLRQGNGGAGYQVITVTTTWTQFKPTAGSNASTAFNFDIVSVGTVGVQTIYAWGAQLEAGAFALSPIPTTTVPATRAADSIVLAGAAQTAALAAKAMFFQTNGSLGGTSPRFLQFNTGGSNLQFGTTTNVTASDGTNTAAAVIGGSLTSANVIKAAFGLDNTSMTAIAAGGTKVTQATSTWATNATGTVQIGNRGSDLARALNGYMARLAFGQSKGQFDGVTAP